MKIVVWSLFVILAVPTLVVASESRFKAAMCGYGESMSGTGMRKIHQVCIGSEVFQGGLAATEAIELTLDGDRRSDDVLVFQVERQKSHRSGKDLIDLVSKDPHVKFRLTAVLNNGVPVRIFGVIDQFQRYVSAKMTSSHQ